MEPTDQLDAANRRLPEGRVRRFTKTAPSALGLFVFPRKSLKSQNVADVADLAGVAWNRLPLAGGGTGSGTGREVEKTVAVGPRARPAFESRDIEKGRGDS